MFIAPPVGVPSPTGVRTTACTDARSVATPCDRRRRSLRSALRDREGACRRADPRQGARVAARPPGVAYLSPVLDQPQPQPAPPLEGPHSPEVVFDLHRIGLVRELQPTRQASDVRVDR